MGGRIIVESVAGCLWNRWPDGRGIRSLKRIVVVTHRTTPVADDAHFGDVQVCHQRDRKRGTLETLLGQGK